MNARQWHGRETGHSAGETGHSARETGHGAGGLRSMPGGIASVVKLLPIGKVSRNRCFSYDRQSRMSDIAWEAKSSLRKQG